MATVYTDLDKHWGRLWRFERTAPNKGAAGSDWMLAPDFRASAVWENGKPCITDLTLYNPGEEDLHATLEGASSWWSIFAGWQGSPNAHTGDRRNQLYGTESVDMAASGFVIPGSVYYDTTQADTALHLKLRSGPKYPMAIFIPETTAADAIRVANQRIIDSGSNELVKFGYSLNQRGISKTGIEEMGLPIEWHQTRVSKGMLYTHQGISEWLAEGLYAFYEDQTFTVVSRSLAKTVRWNSFYRPMGMGGLAFQGFHDYANETGLLAEPIFNGDGTITVEGMLDASLRPGMCIDVISVDAHSTKIVRDGEPQIDRLPHTFRGTIRIDKVVHNMDTTTNLWSSTATGKPLPGSTSRWGF